MADKNIFIWQNYIFNIISFEMENLQTFLRETPSMTVKVIFCRSKSAIVAIFFCLEKLTAEFLSCGNER